MFSYCCSAQLILKYTFLSKGSVKVPGIEDCADTNTMWTLKEQTTRLANDLKNHNWLEKKYVQGNNTIASQNLLTQSENSDNNGAESAGMVISSQHPSLRSAKKETKRKRK